MQNKKIKNAKPLEYDGIAFKSIFEATSYRILKENGFSPQYEPEKTILFKGYKPERPWYKNGVPMLTKGGNVPKLLDWCYTPDFKLEINGFDVYLETKGFPNDIYPYKRKLFIDKINGRKALFFEITDKKGLYKTIEILKDGRAFV